MKTNTKKADFNRKSLVIPVDDEIRQLIVHIKANGARQTTEEIVAALMMAAAKNEQPKFVSLLTPDATDNSLPAVVTALKDTCEIISEVRSLAPGKDKDGALAKAFPKAVELWGLAQRLAKHRLVDAEQLTSLRKIKMKFTIDAEDLRKKAEKEPENTKTKAEIAGLEATIELFTKLGI